MDIRINRSCQPYLFICWWEKWSFLLLASSFNFASKFVMAGKSKAVVKFFICHTDAKLVLHEVDIWKRRIPQVRRPNHNENLHCSFAKCGKIFRDPSFYHKVNSQMYNHKIYFTVTLSWNEINSSVHSKNFKPSKTSLSQWVWLL